MGNPAFERITGYGLDDIRGHRPGDILVCGETDPAATADIRAAAAAGEAISREVLHRRRDGRDLWSRFDLQPVRTADDRLDGFAVTLIDITERRQAEREQARAARLGRITEEALNEVFVFDAESLRFIEVNRGARENLGYSAAELAGMTPLDIKPAFDAASFAALLAPLRSGAERKLTFITEHRRRDGSRYPAEITLQLMTEGRPVFVALALDATERVRAEKAARTAREQLLGAVETLPDGFVLYDRDDRLVLCNSRYREFYADSAPAMVEGATVRGHPALWPGARPVCRGKGARGGPGSPNASPPIAPPTAWSSNRSATGAACASSSAARRMAGGSACASTSPNRSRAGPAPNGPSAGWWMRSTRCRSPSGCSTPRTGW